MSRQRKSASWSRPYFLQDTDKGTWKCIFKADGLECGHTFTCPSFHKDNFERHMEKEHNISGAQQLKPGMRRLDEFVRVNNFTVDERWLHLFAEHGIPFRLVDNPDFLALVRAGTPPSVKRRAFADKCAESGSHYRKEYLKNFRSPTLCMDIGTVHRRYLVFSLVENGATMVTRVVCDTEMEDHRMTKANIRRALLAEIHRLAGEGVTVVHVVADNAANVQITLNRDDDDERVDPPVDPELAAIREEFPTDVLAVWRCAAHVIQLAINDVENIWSPYYETAKVYFEANKARLRLVQPNTTRWSSKYQLVMDILKKANVDLHDGQKTKLDHLQALLKPAHEATNRVQSDHAPAGRYNMRQRTTCSVCMETFASHRCKWVLCCTTVGCNKRTGLMCTRLRLNQVPEEVLYEPVVETSWLARPVEADLPDFTWSCAQHSE